MMQYLFALKQPVVVSLVVVFYLCAAVQILHLLLMIARKDEKFLSLPAALELLIFLHLVCGCAATNSVQAGYDTLLLRFYMCWVPIQTLLWVNVAAAVLAFVLAIKNRKHKRRRYMFLADAFVLALSTPVLVDVFGELITFAIVLDAAYFVFRTTASLALDVRRSFLTTSCLSLINAIRNLPEGVLFADKKGRVLFVNDSMRLCLASLGFKTDFLQANEMWEKIAQIGTPYATPSASLPNSAFNLQNSATNSQNSNCSSQNSDASLQHSDANLLHLYRVTIGDGHTRQFAKDQVVIDRKAITRVVAVDISAEEAISARLERANKQLQKANVELENAVRDVEQIARNESVLYMKTKVHDIIGQRLSILHRYLESDVLDLDKLEQISALLSNVVADLNEEQTTDPKSELDFIKNAYSMVGIDVFVHGELPANKTVASAFVQIIREATTNAAKHAQARAVIVDIDASDGSAGVSSRNIDTSDAGGTSNATMHYKLKIANDVNLESVEKTDKHHEGTGMAHMRDVAAKIGATFKVASRSPFIIEVEGKRQKPYQDKSM